MSEGGIVRRQTTASPSSPHPQEAALLLESKWRNAKPGAEEEEEEKDAVAGWASSRQEAAVPGALVSGRHDWRFQAKAAHAKLGSREFLDLRRRGGVGVSGSVGEKLRD